MRLSEGLARYDTFPVRHEHKDTDDEFALFVMGVDLTDDDIVLGEGRQIVFVDPATVGDLPLTIAARIALPRFLASDRYRQLDDGTVMPAELRVDRGPGDGRRGRAASTSDRTPARWHRHRGRQHLAARDGRPPASTGSGHRAAARSGSRCCPTAGCWSPTRTRGLLAVDPATGASRRSLTERRRPPDASFCNNAAVAANGDIWFSDSIDRLPDRALEEGLRRGHPHRPAAAGSTPDGTVEVRARGGLAFANGVALAADESFVAVAETAARTVVRHWLTGARAGSRDLLAEDLPGYPDNIARGATAWSG